MEAAGVSILHVIRTDYGARSTDGTRLVAGRETLLLSALEGIAAENEETKESAEQYISMLCAVLGLESPENPEPRSTTVLEFLDRCEMSGRCLRPGCGETELSEVHGVRRFARCELCRIVRYCSKACQRADWKRARHKDMCPLVASMIQRGVQVGVDQTQEEFDAALCDTGYDSRDLDALYEWASIMDLLPVSANGPVKPLPVAHLS
ncbi:hypothetical protein AURDEDRAFT_173814 [Auricularia subglabra TFB-10046 SS5]|nr:hypothetical protein AURDEDRAFT_173814 [Auricularia subglabra TFB-10046 SS5]